MRACPGDPCDSEGRCRRAFASVALVAKLATPRVVDPSHGMAVEPSALLSLHRMYAQAPVAGRTCGPAFPLREVSWPKSARTCSSPLARPTPSPVASAPRVSRREPCFSAEGGADACSVLASTDRPALSTCASGAMSAFLESDRCDLSAADDRNGDVPMARDVGRPKPPCLGRSSPW